MSNWEWKKLGDLYPISMGKTPPRGDSSCWDKNRHTKNVWVTIADISSNENQIITESKEHISDKAAKSITLVSPNSLLLSFKLSIGKMAFAGIPLYTNEAIVNFPPTKDIDLQYLHKYFLYYNWDKASEGDTKVKGKTLNKEKLKNIDVLVPPLAEQKRIVKTLDEKFAKIDKLKTAAETNLKNAREIFNAELEKTFNEKDFWKTARLGEIALEYGRGKSKHRPRNDKCLFGGEYPFIQTGDIRNSEKYIERYSETYNEIGLAQSKLWPKGTLCITIAANIAETAILTFPCCFPDSVIGFVPNEQYTSVDFIYYVIQYFKTELQKISKGAAQDNLNLTKLESMDFPLPPLSEQKRIVAHLDKLSEKVKRLEEIYRRTIADCEELKKSILKKTFEGES